MDVVLLTTQLSRAGAEIQLVRLGQTLARRGWKIGVISLLPKGAYGEELQAAGIPLYECSRSPRLSPPMAMVVAARTILQLVRWRPAVLVTFNYHGDILGRVCGRVAGIRAIVASLRTAHAKTPLREKVYRGTEALVDLTVSNSQAALTYMIERDILTPAKTLVIPNGAITADWPAPIRREDARAAAYDPGGFDAVVTLFFLDCFTPKAVRALVGRARAGLRPGGLWIWADFAVPAGACVKADVAFSAHTDGPA